MDINKKQQFFELLIYEAAKGAGDTSGIVNDIKDFMNTMGIEADTKRIEQFNYELQNKKLESEKETAAAELSKLAAEYTGADANKKQELIVSIQAQNETLQKRISTSKINRFPTWADYESAWHNENENDFSLELFNRLSFPEGTISYIGARTGRGKTTAMVNIGIEALFPQKETDRRKILFISLEETHKQIIRRFSLCLAYRNANAQTRLELLSVKNPYTGRTDPKNAYKNWKREKEIGGDGSAAFVKAITDADNKIKTEVMNGNLIFFNGTGAELFEILSAVNTRNRGDIILFDYIQKIPADKKSRSGYTDLERIRDGSQILDQIVKQRNCVIIAGAQFNRDSQKGTASKQDEFTDADFRGCGDLEQDGTNLIGIGRTADKQQTYFSVIKAREHESTDQKYTLDFAGGYSFMEYNSKVPEKPNNQNKQSNEQQPRKIWKTGIDT
jgi:hypothetical protein